MCCFTYVLMYAILNAMSPVWYGIPSPWTCGWEGVVVVVAVGATGIGGNTI